MTDSQTGTSPDTPTVRATGPLDLLALVPGLLGFHPEDSVVLLTVGDAVQPFHARVDLPTDAHDIDGLAAHLTGVAVRGAVSRVAVVVYTDDGSLARIVVDALYEELMAACVDLVCVVRSDGRRWWVLDTEGESGGTAYDIATHPLMTRAVVEGTVVLGSRRALADTLVGRDPQETEVIAASAADRLVSLAAAADGPLGAEAARHHLRAEAQWVTGRVRRFLVDGERLEPEEVARLATLLVLSDGLRDVAWAEMSRANAARHVDLWRDVVRRAPRHLRAPSAALLGFAAWLSGNGALAWCAVESAQEADPDYRLAELLARVLAGAVPPSTWQPPTRDELSLLRH